jgi:hypothetical protein
MPRTRTNKNQLPKTGQVVSWDGEGFDDGGYQEGWPKAGPLAVTRFIDNGDNTITDRATNLQWIKRPELIIPDGLNANNLGVEKGDWSAGVAFSAGDIATKNTDSSAWICLIAHTSINPPNYADATDYNVGDVVLDAAGDGTYYQCGTAHTSSGSTISADTGGSWTQVATDASSLFAFDQTLHPTYWQQSIWAQSNSGGGVNPVYMSWNSGVANAMITKSGKSDWKMPNLKELISIVDYGRVGPAIDPIFANCQSDYYWSSTIYAGYTGYAWYVDFRYGNVNYDPRYYNYYVRPVRQY